MPNNIRTNVYISYWKNDRRENFDIEVDENFFKFFPECKESYIYFLSREMIKKLIERVKRVNYGFDQELEFFFTDYLEEYIERPNMKPRVIIELEREIYHEKHELLSFRSGFNLNIENRYQFLKKLDNLIERYISVIPKQNNKHEMIRDLLDKYNDEYHYIKEKYVPFVELCLRDRLKSIPSITIRGNK